MSGMHIFVTSPDEEALLGASSNNDDPKSLSSSSESEGEDAPMKNKVSNQRANRGPISPDRNTASFVSTLYDESVNSFSRSKTGRLNGPPPLFNFKSPPKSPRVIHHTASDEEDDESLTVPQIHKHIEIDDDDDAISVSRASVQVDLNAYAMRHNLSQAERENLFKLDDDSDGTLTMDEVLHGALRLQQEKKKVRRLEFVVIFVCMLFILACLSILGVTLLANDISKDMDAAGADLISRETGRTVATQQKTSEFSLLDYFYMPMSMLQSVEKLAFSAAGVEYMLRVAKIEKKQRKLIFYGFFGDQLIVERGTALYSNANGEAERILPVPRKSRRSLLQEDGSTDPDPIFTGTCTSCHDFVPPTKHPIWEEEDSSTIEATSEPFISPQGTLPVQVRQFAISSSEDGTTQTGKEQKKRQKNKNSKRKKRKNTEGTPRRDD